MEYLVRSRILKLSEAQNPRDAQDILSNLPSIVNVFNNSHQKGLIFSQREEQGTAQNMCQVVQRDTEGKITL